MKAASLVLGLSTLLCASAGAQSSVQRCVGAVCLRDRHLTEAVFVERFGAGAVLTDADAPRRRQHCFFLGASSRWILFTFEPASTQRTSELMSILVSSVELCAPRVPPKRPMGLAFTEAGIGLGHRRADIERVLGPPRRTDEVEESAANMRAAAADIIYSSRLGRTRFVYEVENDTLFNFFYLGDSGELRSLALVDSP